jgi:hypothetical protein
MLSGFLLIALPKFINVMNYPIWFTVVLFGMVFAGICVVMFGFFNLISD